MRTFFVRPLLLLLLMAPLAGCFTTVYFKEQTRLECPEPPPPVCKPDHFDEVTIDTSSAPRPFSTHYLTIDRVDGLDTRSNEYSVAFPPGSTGREGLATLRPSRAGEAQEQERIVNVRFQAPEKAALKEEVTARDVNGAVGGGAVSPRGDTILFAAKGEGSVSGDYDLYGATYANNTITSARRRRISSVIYWDAQPALAPDGRTIYFSSDRRDGFGGTDIYVSRLGGNNQWSTPENVGPGVNTGCDELSPFVSGDGRWLYFSSAGHATVGGYDLFRAPISGGHIGKAENLGRPINTPADELFPSAPPNASPDTLLYYSSNQKVANNFDIYVLHRVPRKGQAISNAKLKTVTLEGTVRDHLGRPVDSARVTIEAHDPPGKKDSTLTAHDGGYKFQVEEGHKYEVVAGSDSTLYSREEVRIPITNGRNPIIHDVTLSDTITFRVNFPFNNASDPYEFTLDEHGLPSDLRWTDMIDHAADFLKQFNGGPRGRFVIIGHTDPVGSDPFNLDLGQRRAEFIRRELIRRGVSPEILVTGSRGESEPLPRVANEPEDQYHARLRRVELIRKK
ncbi:MAG TPA: OmpA family protein [Candidatus Kapabacteria bacterium]|nr:OmpA family protein [Candidatus Kapabacteria bacterium]